MSDGGIVCSRTHKPMQVTKPREKRTNGYFLLNVNTQSTLFSGYSSVHEYCNMSTASQLWFTVLSCFRHVRVTKHSFHRSYDGFWLFSKYFAEFIAQQCRVKVQTVANGKQRLMSVELKSICNMYLTLYMHTKWKIYFQGLIIPLGMDSPWPLDH